MTYDSSLTLEKNPVLDSEEKRVVPNRVVSNRFNEMRGSSYATQRSPDLLTDRAFRASLGDMLETARNKGMDFVLYPDASLALIENKPVAYSYNWSPKIREFVRSKSASRRSSSNKKAIAPDYEEEKHEEYAE